MLLVLIPSASEKLDDETHKSLGSTLIPRWKRIVHPGVLLFMISGFYNYFRAIPLHKGDGLYHVLIGTKMVLALGVFFLAAALVGRSEKLEHFRENRSKWLKVLVLLAAAIVTISGFAKVRGVPTNQASTTLIESAP